MLGNALASVISVLIGAAIYVIMLFATKAIREEELKFIPKSGKIIRIIEKIKGR